MTSLRMLLEQLKNQRDLEKFAEAEGISTEYPNRPEEAINEELLEAREELKIQQEESERLAAKKKELEAVAVKELEKYINDATNSGQKYEPKLLSDFFTPEYNELEGLSREAKNKKLLAQGKIDALEHELEEREDIHYLTTKDIIDDVKKNGWKPILIGVLFGLTGLRLILAIVKFVRGVLQLNPDMLAEAFPWFILFTIGPIIVWVWSTCYDEFTYKKQKVLLLYLVVVNAAASFLLVLSRIVLTLLLKPLMATPTTAVLTPVRIVQITRVLTFAFSLIPIGLLLVAFDRYLSTDLVREKIYNYVYAEGKDFRKDVNFKYDLHVVRDVYDGAVKAIKEADLFLHFLIDGGTGTGKTSSILLPIIKEIMDRMVHNVDYQKKQVYGLLKDGKLRVKQAFDDRKFNLDNFEASPELPEEEQLKIAEDLKKLDEKSPVAGIIIACPNDDMADKAYTLAKNRNLNVYRVDPIRTDEGKVKEGRIGLNPLYISPLIQGVERYDTIVTNATIVMDLMSSMSEDIGSVDSYFDSVNRIQTVVVCKLLLLTHESIYKVQPTLRDVQALLNDFQKIRPYLFELIRLYGNNGQPKDLPKEIEKQSTAQFNAWLAKQKIDCGIWQDVFVIITKELLDEKLGPVAYERANGLRNQLNIFLNTPRVNELICTNDTIDMDLLLAKGGIVIFNYALKLGNSSSKALGQFFIQIYQEAILRRPSSKFCRPFFCVIDELPTLVSKNMAPLWTLARQYKCSTISAMQNLNQLKQKKNMEFLLNTVLSSCGQVYVFNRVTPDEAKYFQERSGTKTEMVEQQTISQTSITTPNPSLSYSTRITPTQEPYMTADKFMYAKFRNGVMFTTEDGTPMRPFEARVQFLKPWELLGLKRPGIRWQKYYDDDTIGKENASKMYEPVIVSNESKIRRTVRILSGKKPEGAAGENTGGETKTAFHLSAMGKVKDVKKDDAAKASEAENEEAKEKAAREAAKDAEKAAEAAEDAKREEAYDPLGLNQQEGKDEQSN